MHCTKCGSVKFRISRMKPSDFMKLITFRFPVRCRICNRRRFVPLSTAIGIQKADSARHQELRKSKPTSSATLPTTAGNAGQ